MAIWLIKLLLNRGFDNIYKDNIYEPFLLEKNRGNKMRFLKVLSLLLLAAVLTSCATTLDVLPVDEPAHVINADAENFLVKKSYKKAADRFLELERQHPYSKYTQAGMMKAIEAYFVIRDYDDVAFTADRYIVLYPRARDVKRAYFLRAEAFYIRLKDVKRDQRVTKQAQDALRALQKRFPRSEEGKLAAKKLLVTYDLLAAKELEIGRYYLNERNFPAAINRFKVVVSKYQTTKQIEEALARLVEAYLALGLRDEATANAALLGRNYRSGEWYSYAFNLLNKG